MHSRNFGVAFLAFFLSSFTAQGMPMHPQPQCDTISTVTQTVTVTARATPTTKPGNSANIGNNNNGNTGNGGNNGNNGGNSGNNNSTNGDNGQNGGGNGGNNNGNTNNNGGNTGSNGGNTGNNGGNTGNNGGNTGNNGGNTGNNGGSADPESSLTLDPKVIALGFANNGQDVPTAGQVASLTSKNNFINFCSTVKLPITNGKQIKTGSCNPAPMGVIPSTNNMPSSKFVNPKNFGTIKANTAFTIEMAIKNMETGFFVNANENYFAAPQFLNKNGQIQGHSHVVIEQLSAIDQTTVTDPTKFVFFKGLNGAAQGGKLTADVINGLPVGFYKLSSINTAANHQPVVVPIAQHGSLDDMIYFTVTADGQVDGGSNGNPNVPATSVQDGTSVTVNATTSSAIGTEPTSATGAVTTTAKGGKGGKATSSRIDTTLPTAMPTGEVSSPASDKATSVTKGAATAKAGDTTPASTPTTAGKDRGPNAKGDTIPTKTTGTPGASAQGNTAATPATTTTPGANTKPNSIQDASQP